MRLSADTYRRSIAYVVNHGDTDIFPYPFELAFFSRNIDAISVELANLDLSKYHPTSLIEAMVPKSRYGFRVAHQPFPVDTVIYTALVLHIADEIEAGRDKIEEMRAFSYRKAPKDQPNFFLQGHSYRDWLDWLQGFAFEDEYSHAIRTDISDYYQRIYRHRLENILKSLTKQDKAVDRIEKIIADWRSGQSFGIPVGGDASRLLAEVALNDIDMSLIAEGYRHTRYVDDFIIFVKTGQDPYAALAFLAQHLSVNEGLSLNGQKTRILDWDKFISEIYEPESQDEESKEHAATERLFWATYGNDNARPEDLAALAMKDLSSELDGLLEEPFWDMGKIRIILQAMRVVGTSDVAEYVRKRLSDLVPFAKDVCLLIEHFHKESIAGFENLNAEVIDLLLSTRMRPLASCRAWFLELGVRRVVEFTLPEVRKLESLTGQLDRRQLNLIRSAARDVTYFRSMKARVHEIALWEQPSFIFGARCLPLDEYSHWIRGMKSRLTFPLAAEFANWCLAAWEKPT